MTAVVHALCWNWLDVNFKKPFIRRVGRQVSELLAIQQPDFGRPRLITVQSLRKASLQQRMNRDGIRNSMPVSATFVVLVRPGRRIGTDDGCRLPWREKPMMVMGGHDGRKKRLDDASVWSLAVLIHLFHAVVLIHRFPSSAAVDAPSAFFFFLVAARLSPPGFRPRRCHRRKVL
jgi:hypothetical protein